MAEEKATIKYINKLIKSKNEKGEKMVNNYVILQQLGEGAYATVYAGRENTTQQLVALKKMSKRTLQRQREYSQGPMGRPKITTALDKVKKEIDIMFTLHHTNIIQLLCVIDDEEEDSLYLVLEYASYGQIMHWDGELVTYKSKVWKTTDGGLSESILRHVVHDVVHGLEYIHSLHIIHRDLKPDNLLVCQDGTIKIADFGVARKFADNEDGFISDTHGTYHFFSPEMCTGEKYSGYISDIWSLGVTLYILIFGTVPFMSKDNNPQELFEMISNNDIVYPSSRTLSPPLKSLLDGLLMKDPKQRLTLSQIKSHPFLESTGTLEDKLVTITSNLTLKG